MKTVTAICGSGPLADCIASTDMLCPIAIVTLARTASRRVAVMMEIGSAAAPIGQANSISVPISFNPDVRITFSFAV